MSVYVLLHGGWHGGWCWRKVVPLLKQAGHEVFAPDLPGHGQDSTPLQAILPEHSIQRISSIVDEQEEQVILVGHSSGGMLITAIAQQRPEKIKTLVYLSAFLLPPGIWPPTIAQEDKESILQSCLVVDEQRQVVMVRKEAAREVFYADCTDEDADWATRLLVPEPLGVKATGEAPSQITTAEANIDHIPRVYIECLQDKALGPTMQKKMYTALPCRKVYSLATSHSPFLSAPEQLAACLLDVASLNRANLTAGI